MKDAQKGDRVKIAVELEVGPYVIVPTEQASRVQKEFQRHRVPHRVYPTVSNALTIVYLLGNTALEYAQALLDAIP